ncbi:hypothetical protein JYU34_016536 [Plutella xylostella]|uniref:Complex I assembly factor TIMMDC1, mitochondrial n=1 Tax=Plutella xylostella TaxID=51655 RepID=A0ABQ7Q2W4_PLUXY|nr:hypothetical protein JYU34_016536 [Plutella xylostella]
MFRVLNIARVTPVFVFPLMEDRNKYDGDNLNRKPKKEINTGYDRLKEMYTRNEYLEASVELYNVVQATFTGAFIGACMGGFVRSREAYLYFIENNQATIFTSTMEAKKKLQDYVTVAFAKGATYWGWRLALFTGIFSLVSTTISVYRGETSVIEYTVAGAITGGLYRANLGLAATCVGAGLGGVLSSFGGLAIVLLLKITGVTMEDIRRALHTIKEAREDQFNQAVEKAATIKNDDLTIQHDLLVQEKGEKKIEDI